MNVLGISAYYHDSAAALVRDGDIVAAAQEERFSRKKHDHAFPAQAAAYCLREAGLSVGQLDYVVFYEKPLTKFDRLLETYLSYAPRGIKSFSMAIPLWLREKLHLPREIRKGLGNYEGELLFMTHHLSHAASAFYPSPFERAAILTIDGVGEWTTTSIGVGRGNLIELLEEIRFPHSLGLLYSAFTYFTGFRVNSGEYKLMGLAPYGRPKYVDLIRENLIEVRPDGSFHLNMAYFDYCAGLTMTNGRFDRLFGGPRRLPEAPLTEREMDLAASVQVVAEDVMMGLARRVRNRTDAPALCLAGGVALNCVANGRILREGLFDEMFIQPAAGDAGGALGAALAVWYQYLNRPRGRPSGRDFQKGSLLGPAFSPDDIARMLKANNAVYRRFMDEAELVGVVADLLMAEKVVGWFQGRMEFGPRALGNRSILADARSRHMQRTLNLKIKFRESFRPFAPIVLEERAGEYFELSTESPYMLLVAPVRAEHRLPVGGEEQERAGIDRLAVARSDIPAVTHVDYSARIQTVDHERNPRLHALMKAFEAGTGCGVLVNTSFNVRGEPIVHLPSEAYRCFMFTHMDALVIDDYLLLKEDQPEMPGAREYLARFPLD